MAGSKKIHLSRRKQEDTPRLRCCSEAGLQPQQLSNNDSKSLVQHQPLQICLPIRHSCQRTFVTAGQSSTLLT